MAENTLQQRFVEAWGTCENPELDSVNPHFKNRYASLKATLKAIRSSCVPLGIAYMQKLTRLEDGTRELRSYVTDGGDAIEISAFPVECPPNPQSFGSNMTYAKRQQAQADWCITGEEDDDGEAAAQNAQKSPGNARRATTPKKQQTPPQGDEERSQKRKKMLATIAQLMAQCIENGVTQEGVSGWLVANMGTDSLETLSDAQLIAVGQHYRAAANDSAALLKGAGDVD